jgi:non-ribosomal peptide synthetase component F
VTIDRLLCYFEQLLTAAVTNPGGAVADLPLLTTEESSRIIVEWNQTRTAYPRDKCIQQLFQEQAEASPSAVAVNSGGLQITYDELNARANQLAAYLRKFSVSAEVPVGICVQRSIDMVVGLLAILKAGVLTCRWTQLTRKRAGVHAQ